MYIIDAHCDAPTMMYRGRDFGKDNPGVQVDFPKMQRGGITASFFALYIPASLNEADAADYALVLLDSLKRQVEANESRVAFAFDENSLRHNASNGLVSVFIGLENGSALLGRKGMLERLYKEGVRYVTLCHSADNGLCDSCTGAGTWGGLSPRGKEMVREMNSVGMLVDVAHTSNATVRDVLDCSSKPVAYTHGCCSSLCSHKRNLPDELLAGIAANGGVSCMSIFPCFLSDRYSDFDDDNPDGREMIAKRQNLMQSRLTDAEKLKEAAAEEKANADMELRAMQNRVKSMIESAKDEANTEKERILEDAARQAEATLENANATIEKQKAEMRKDLQREIVDVALAASTKLMGKDDLAEQDQRALESFVKEIQDESGR